MSVDTEVIIDEKIKHTIQEPLRYKVVMLNDDQTPMDWVIDVLVSIFKHSETTAKELTLTIHNDGSGVAGLTIDNACAAAGGSLQDVEVV